MVCRALYGSLFLSLFPSVSTAVIKKNGLQHAQYAHDLWLSFHYIRCRGHRGMNKAVYFFNEYWMGECEPTEAFSRKKWGVVRADIRTRGRRGRWITCSWNLLSDFIRSSVLKLIFYPKSLLLLLLFLGRISVSTVSWNKWLSWICSVGQTLTSELETTLHKHI